MPSTYDRLVYLERAHAEGRLNSLLFSADGPQALIPTMGDMIRLIEAVNRNALLVPAEVNAALRPLIMPREGD